MGPPLTDRAESEGQTGPESRFGWVPSGSETGIVDKGLTTQVLPGDAWKEQDRAGEEAVQGGHQLSRPRPDPQGSCGMSVTLSLTLRQGSQPAHSTSVSYWGQASRGHKLP